MDRTQRKEARLLLDKLLKIELEILRKRFRPYKRRLFLRNKVTIGIQKGEKGVLGYYENNKKTDRQFRYSHKVSITEYHIEKYYNYCKFSMKRYAVSDLRDTIRHELVHAFVFEEFEEWEEIKNSHGDYSPIFLGCLYWSKGHSGHPYANKFLETDLGKKIQACKTYDEVYIHLIYFIFEFQKEVRKINVELSKNVKDYRELNIIFNQKGAGIVKRSYIKLDLITIKNGKTYCQKATSMTLGLGFLVTPKILLENYQKKFENGALAMIHSEELGYAIGSELKQKVTLIEK